MFSFNSFGKFKWQTFTNSFQHYDQTKLDLVVSKHSLAQSNEILNALILKIVQANSSNYNPSMVHIL
jgi:hypothetical protein